MRAWCIIVPISSSSCMIDPGRATIECLLAQDNPLIAILNTRPCVLFLAWSSGYSIWGRIIALGKPTKSMANIWSPWKAIKINCIWTYICWYAAQLVARTAILRNFLEYTIARIPILQMEILASVARSSHGPTVGIATLITPSSGQQKL